MKTPITTAQAMSHPDVAATINALGKMCDELRAECDVYQKLLMRWCHDAMDNEQVKELEAETIAAMKGQTHD